MGGKHINCAAVKMSKKIKIVVVGKPAPRLELLSILEGLGGWMDVWGFFTIISTIYLSFLVSIHVITVLAKSWENLIQDLSVAALHPCFVF